MFALLTQAALAANYDPALDWRTLDTEHFNITFHQGEEQLANEVGHIAEDIFDELTVDMAWEPVRDTEIVLVDHTDIANGYAMTVPYNTIVIFVTAPQEHSGLSLYEDWSTMILTHEYAHILHLDNVQGLPAMLRKVLGRVVSTNSLSPWWITEGSATYQETRHSTGGRGRSTHTDMVIRQSALEGTFPTLGQMDGFMTGPPGGNTRYLYGQSLLKYIADHTSDDAITRWNLTYGSWVPYLLPAKAVFGQSFPEWYSQWKAAIEAEAAETLAGVEQTGLMQGEFIELDLDGSCYGPAFSPQGDKLVFSCSDRRTGSSIYLADGDGLEPTVELDDRLAKNFTWRPDGEAFAYSASHVVNDFNLYEDIYFHELGTDTAPRLTSGKRARDPAFSPDGSDLLVVRNKTQQNSLARMRIDQTLETLNDWEDHTQLSTPSWSPDGRFIAMSVWQDGFRDIWLFTEDGQPYRRLTMDTHIDRDPSWSRDGKTLYFVSDRSGISNVYALDLADEHLYQVTNVVGGAFQPTARADGEVLAYQHYTSNGYRVALMPLDRSTWLDRGTVPLPLEHRGDLNARVDVETVAGTGSTGIGAPSGTGRTVPMAGIADQPSAGADVDDVTRVQDDLLEQEYAFDFPVVDYKPLPTLFPPRYVLPSVYSTTTGFMGVLSTNGIDVLRRHAWSGMLTYRTDAKAIGGGVSYTYNRWRPVMTWGLNSYVVPYGAIYYVPDGGPGGNIPVASSTGLTYWDQRSRAYTMVSYSPKQNQAVYARYTGVYRDSKEDLDAIEKDNGYEVYTPALPTRGLLSTVGVGWRYSRGKGYSYSISPEDSRYLALDGEWTIPYVGDRTYGGSFTLDEDGAPQPFNRVQVTGELREYIELSEKLEKLPLYNHVFAFRIAGGVSRGDQLRYGSFRLGGSYGESGYYRLPSEWKMLRGFPVATASGDNYYLGTFEYRFPLLRLDWGWNTLPFFMRSVHGAVFVDAGDAWDTDSAPGTPLAGVGAELRLGTIVGWGLGFNARVGYAVGIVGEDGISPTSTDSLYFRIGNTF